MEAVKTNNNMYKWQNCTKHSIKDHLRMEEAKSSSEIEGAETSKSVCELIDEVKDNK